MEGETLLSGLAKRAKFHKSQLFLFGKRESSFHAGNKVDIFDRPTRVPWEKCVLKCKCLIQIPAGYDNCWTFHLSRIRILGRFFSLHSVSRPIVCQTCKAIELFAIGFCSKPLFLQPDLPYSYRHVRCRSHHGS